MTADDIIELGAALLRDADDHGQRARGEAWEREARMQTHLTNAAEALGALLDRAQRAEAETELLRTVMRVYGLFDTLRAPRSGR